MRRNQAEYDARCAERARSAFAGFTSPIEMQERAGEIAALPQVDWKGRRFHTLRCLAGHDYNATEALCWSLLRLRHFACPFHPGALYNEPRAT